MAVIFTAYGAANIYFNNLTLPLECEELLDYHRNRSISDMVLLQNISRFDKGQYRLPAFVEGEISDFRPFAKQIVKEIFEYPAYIELDGHVMKGDGWEIWIANGEEWCRLHKPREIGLKYRERLYIWNLYESLKDHKESGITIK